MGRILVVDDHDSLRKGLVRALANERLALKPNSPLAHRYRDQGTRKAA